MNGHNDHLIGIAALLLLIVFAVLAVIAICSPRYRRRIGLATAWVAGGLVAVYLVGRGIVEFFIIHYDNPASYHSSWGGPSLVGVFLVHSGPGFLVLVAAAVAVRRKIRSTRQASPVSRPRQVTFTRGSD